MKGKMKKDKKAEKYNTGGGVGLGAPAASAPKFKRGGKVHKADGKAAMKRADKKSRGGKTMSPSSPLSGAEPKTNRPGFSASAKVDKENN